MSKNTPTPPAPVIVNPQKSASGQAEFNEDAARKQRALNMVGQETPQGTLSWAPTGTETEGIPDFKAVTQLSPEQQKLYDTSTASSQQYGDIASAQLGRVNERLSKPFDISQFGAAPDAPNIASRGAAPEVNPEVRKRQQDAILERFRPQLDQDRAALQTSLANQGFMTGSEGYDNALDQNNRSRNDFYLGADIQAGDEMQRIFGLENAARARDISEASQDYSYSTNARDRAIQEGILNRGQPMSELSTFMTGSQPKDPRFVATPRGNIAAPDFMGAQFGSAGQQNAFNQNAYNQQMGQSNANMQGLYGLAGTAGKVAAASYGGDDGWTWGA
jgi:hypothetical protein